MTDTGSNPWTMMVMYFNTEPTRTTMKRSWWSQYLATMAIRHFIMPIVLRHFHLGAILSMLQRVVLELLDVVELSGEIIGRYFSISQCGL
jgi:hypothetical protein